MGDQDPILPCCPFQNGAIISARETCILNANYVQIGLAAQ
jgi:hypothetical protein